MLRMRKRLNLTIQAVTKSPIHVPTAAIFIKLSFLMPMYSVTMWGLQGKEEQEWREHKKCIICYEGSKVKAGRRRQKHWQKEPKVQESVEGEREWSLPLSIMMLAVRVNQYQSNPVKTMSDGSTFHKVQGIVNYLHQRNGIYAASPLPFGPAVFGKSSICWQICFMSSWFQINTAIPIRPLPLRRWIWA